MRPQENVRRRGREGEEGWGKGDRNLPLLYPLCYHSFLFLSLSLSWVLIITRFCVTSLNKALPCLFHFPSASVCVCAPLQGLTIIRSTETDTHTLGMLGDRAQCYHLQIWGCSENNNLCFWQNLLNKPILFISEWWLKSYGDHFIFMNIYCVKNSEDLGENHSMCPGCVHTPQSCIFTCTCDNGHVNMLKNT